MNANTSRKSAWLALFVLVLVWAYSWIVMKQVLRDVGPFDFSALRYLGGAAVLFAVVAARRMPLAPPPWRLTLAIGLTQTAGFQALEQWALVGGGAGHVALLAYTMPFWVVLFAWWLLSERPTARQAAGLELAAAGLVFVLQPWAGLGRLDSAVLALAGGICWALGTVLSKRMFQRHDPHPLTFTAWQMLVGALLLGVVALCVPSRPIAWTAGFVYGLAYSVLLASSLAWLLWLYVVKRLPTSVAGLSALAVPVTAVLMAWALLGETPDLWERIGIVLIAGGLLAVSGVGRHRSPASRR